MSCGTLLRCPLPSPNRSCLPAASLCRDSGPKTQPGTSLLDHPKGVSVQHQPSGNDLTPPAGANSNSDAIAEAQLTHLVSRDDAAQGQNAPDVPEAPMPDAPSVHDIATPRHQIGGRCRKMVHQHTANLRQTQVWLACCMCGIQFSHGEARLQQWGNRETNRHCVHAHCVNGGVGHDHELHPKQPLDQEAVEAVSRQRETVIRAAADTEVLLPLAQDPDQASTAASPPDDDQDLFGREEALRMDEEIMDFQWFQCVSWNSIKDLRGTPYVQHPRRFKFALQQAQHAILRAIMHNNPPLWPPSQLGNLLCSAAGSSWDGVLSARRKATVLTTWMPDSSGLKTVQPWAMVRAECDVALVHSATRRTTTEQKHAHIRKVATLARSGEKGRALAAASNAPPVSVTEQNVQEIKSLYPTGPEPPAPAQALMSNLFSCRQQQLVCACNCAHCSRNRGSPPSAAVPQGWSDHADTAPHDVFSPLAGSQIGHGGQEGIGCQK